MKFSSRTPGSFSKNRLTEAVNVRRRDFIDLTVTNPARAGLETPPQALLALSDERGRFYEPDPRGLLAAREAVCSSFAAHGFQPDPQNVILCASSSEAYSWLFKLLAEPGDSILVPAPSYPLLDALAGLECVQIARYRLDKEDGWKVASHLIEEEARRITATGGRVAAVVLVNPNNPTGTSITEPEFSRLLSLSSRLGWAVISDEVFIDYRFDAAPAMVRIAASAETGLVFSLGGLSKSAGMPQLKLGWIIAGGAQRLVQEALERLEWISDSFLSVGTPVQLALPKLLEAGRMTQARIRERVLTNRSRLVRAFEHLPACQVLPVPGGWSCVIRIPAVLPEEEAVLRLLSENDVLVHPGYFFDFPFEAFLVFSLLPEPDLFREGVARLWGFLEESSKG